MFLKKLYILNDDVVIRDITFRNGLNLIVDSTDSNVRTESGNNVGKTTVLRLIDFCLGGSGESIYKDKEFKGQTNKIVEDFLKGNNIIIQLDLTADLDDEEAKNISIRRNFLQRSQKVLTIDGAKVKTKDFDSTLKSIFFDFNKAKPTFKQIISKNIRDEENRLNNTLRVLNSFTSNDEYEALYLFWLGVDLDFASRKQELIQQIKAEEKIKIRLELHTSIPKINQFLAVLDRKVVS